MWNGRGDEVADGEMDEGTEEEAMELESERDDEIWSNSLLVFSSFRLIIDGDETLYWVRMQEAGEFWMTPMWFSIAKASSSLLAGDREMPSDCLLVFIKEGFRSKVAGRLRRTAGAMRQFLCASLRSELLRQLPLLLSSIPLRPLSLALFW
jgi:hypothetical protein